MAEPTEQEQIKQTQALDKVDKTTIASKDELMKLSKILKEENQAAKLRYDAEEEHRQEEKEKKVGDAEVQEKILEFTKELDKKAEKQEKKDEEEKTKKKEEREKADAIKDKELNFGIKQEGFFGKFAGWTEEFAANVRDKDFADKTRFKYEGGIFTRMGKTLNLIKLGSDEAQRHGEFMEHMEKRKWDLQKSMYNMSVRAAKLAMRGGKAIKDWGVKGLTNMKDKAFNWIKSLGKLLLLLGIWGAALWADANMLKEDWEALKKKLTAWKDKLVKWFGELDGVLDTTMEWWNKIKKWFKETLGVELKLWHVALLAFGLWMFGPKLAFMATMGLAKAGLWAAKKILQRMGRMPKDLPDPKAIDDGKVKAKKAAKAKASWWKRMFGIADDSTKGIPKLDAKWGQNSAKNLKSTGAFWNKHIPNIHQYSDDVAKLSNQIADNPNMKKGFFARMGAKFNTMFNTVGTWASSVGDKVSGWFKGAKSTVGGWFKSTLDTAKNLGKSIIAKGKKALDATVDSAKAIGKNILGKGKAILGGAVDVVKGAGSWLAKIPGAKFLAKGAVGVGKFLAKVAVPLEAARGTWAGAASRGPDDKRTGSERADDASAGMVKSVVDFVAIDLVDLGGMLENALRTDLKEGEEGWLSGVADTMNEWSDETFGAWVEGTRLLDAGGDPTALRLATPKWKEERRKRQRARMDFAKFTDAMGITETKEEGNIRTKRDVQRFDKEGFQRLLLSASKDESFTMMSQMVSGLAKAGKLTALEAERYKMDISKEQAAGTPPIIITNNNSTSNKGSTTMIAASNANNPMNQVLRDW